ncbi:MAG TPA: sigma-70 family RNA polymerase sigma factor [Thermoanaerobaculia bacterium]|jgi:RNA polymerase sigma factor (sigma-70 family)|nr:sigma-70 family RNA polymerase sigma factor [Thermoanaerobaculia bacterium]
MTSVASVMAEDVEALLVANVPLIERLGRAACRGSNMNPADVDDFLSEVKLKLVENDYAALRGFQGRCSIATWLALVVQRQLLDFRAHIWGRFRASAEARRIGETAVRLESLIVRDGMRIEEAVETLRRSGSDITTGDAERIAAKLPRRRPQPVRVPLDDVDADRSLPRVEMAAPDQTSASRTVSAEIRAAVAGLSPNDQVLLQLHFAAGIPVSEISRSLGVPQQPLYRRLRSLCAQFRERLLAAGIDAARVFDLLDDTGADLDLGLHPSTNPGARPSTEEEGNSHA